MIRPEGAKGWNVSVTVYDTTSRTASEVENEIWALLQDSEHLVPEDISVVEEE